MKALAPASMFGGSRESLPLSVLSGTVIHPSGDAASLRGDGTSYNTRSNMNAERASLISASGVTAPALASERNSYIGSNYNYRGGDAASVRSGLLGASGGHGRNDSLSGSITGAYREKERDKDKEFSKEKERIMESEKEREVAPDMVTAPTSPLVDGEAQGAAGSMYTSASALGEALEKEQMRLSDG